MFVSFHSVIGHGNIWLIYDFPFAMPYLWSIVDINRFAALKSIT